MENVISKNSPDDMMVMYKGEMVELIVPIAERALEIHVGRRAFEMDPDQAQGYLQSIIALSKEHAQFEAELQEQLSQANENRPYDHSYICPLQAALLAITMSDTIHRSSIHDPLRLMFKEIYLAASRYKIDADFRIQAIPAGATS